MTLSYFLVVFSSVAKLIETIVMSDPDRLSPADSNSCLQYISYCT